MMSSASFASKYFLRRESTRKPDEIPVVFRFAVELSHFDHISGSAECHIPKRQSPLLIDDFQHGIDVGIVQDEETLRILHCVAVLLEHRHAEAVKCIDISGVIVARQIVYALPHPVRQQIFPSCSQYPLFPADDLCDDDLRTVVETQRYDASSDSPADHHTGIFFPVKTGIVPWKESLARCKQTSEKRQSELPAVGMSAEDEIDAAGGISIEQFRPVRKQNRITVFIPESFYFFRDELRIFFSLLLTGQCLSFRRKFLRKCLIRTEIRVVDADNLDFFAAFLAIVSRLVLENMYPFRFHRFLQFTVFAGNSRLVIARYIIDRRNGDDLIDEIGCDFRIGPPRIDKISGDDDGDPANDCFTSRTSFSFSSPYTEL